MNEPATVLTDLALALLGGVFGFRLLRLGREPGRRAVAWWGVALLGLAAAALGGAAWHGFAFRLPPPAGSALWRLTLAAIGMASVFFCAAVLEASYPSRQRRAGTRIVLGVAALYAVVIARDDSFLWAILVTVPALCLAFVRLGLRGNAPIAAGVVVTILGSGIQLGGVGLHEHFDHNAVYHVIEMFAVWLFYRGGRELRDFDEPR